MSMDSNTRKPRAVPELKSSAYAIDTLDPAIKEEDDLFVASMLQKAVRNIEKENYHTAENLLRQALERSPEHSECLAYLAICLAAGKRRYMTAEKLAKQVILEHPYSAQGYYALGRVNLHGSRRKEAFRLFQKAQRLVLGDHALSNELKGADPRRAPVIKALPRNHPVNIFLGKKRAWLKKGHNLQITLAVVGMVLIGVLIAILG
jgi:tetratricopeptide (TPR) repeat protein